jgi:Viral BACON domain
MAAQGQSFFSASGDSDAFTAGANSVNGVDNPANVNTPSSSPYITMVGGTTLTTSGPGGSWVSETTWNWGSHNGSYVGTSGGISSYYSLPSWQSGISMAANGGSTSHRNIPDVALIADNVYVISGNGSSATLGGTSCAAPLWAGLAALINQQAVTTGKSTVGFLNPTLYAIGKGANYNLNFHDIATGNNVSASSPSLFYATPGYDLCTGWGTPAGQGLIDALAGSATAPSTLSLTPPASFTASGPVGGPFSPSSQIMMLTNGGSASAAWSIANSLAWLSVAPTNGTLAGGSAIPLTLGITSAASRLVPGVYTGSLVITNNSASAAFGVTLNVGQSLVQNGGFESGDFSGWTLVGNTISGQTIYNAVETTSSSYAMVFSGSYGAFLGDTQVASLSQTLATVPGQYYLLSLRLNNPASGSIQRFAVNWNTNAANNTLVNLVNPPSFSWTNFQFLVRAAGDTTTLVIQAENDPSYFGLDDVSVLPVAPAAPGTLSKSGNDVQLSWTTTAGVPYQLQYSTNLWEANWQNLDTPFVATNSSATLLDANALQSAAQRFYRLIVAP